jgi:hypothetical protein
LFASNFAHESPVLSTQGTPLESGKSVHAEVTEGAAVVDMPTTTWQLGGTTFAKLPSVHSTVDVDPEAVQVSTQEEPFSTAEAAQELV